MKCPHCDHLSVSDGARYCPNCGVSLLVLPSASVANKIIDYRELIEKSTQGFVGRQWVRDAVDSFLGADSPRYFLLLGEPGSGKTSFMADLIQRRGYPHHFIGKGSLSGLAASLDWRNPIRFAESLGYQLLRDYGGWIMDWESWGIEVRQEVRDLQGLLVGQVLETFQAVPLRPADRPILTVDQEVERFGAVARVVGVYIENLQIDAEQVVHQLLTVPLMRIARHWPEHQVVLVVDGLDEAEGYSDPRRNIFRLLPDGELPSNVRFLLSSRPGEHLTQEFLDQAQVIWLGGDDDGERSKRVWEDAREFVRRLANEDAIKPMLEQRSLDVDTFSATVASASSGNFLYLHYFAQGLRDGDATLLDLTALPRGLPGIYGDFLGKIKRVRGDISWIGAYKPVLGTLAVAREPLTRRQIADFSGVPQGTAGSALMRLKPFLDVKGEGRDRQYAVYHLSFGEYLVSEDNEDFIDGATMHARIVDYYRGGAASWHVVDWHRVDEYGMRHLARHLRALSDDGARRRQLYELICQPLMQEKRARYGSHSPFAADVELALEVAGPEQRVVSTQAITQEVRLGLVYATLRQLSTNVPAEVVGAFVRTGQMAQARGIAELMEPWHKVQAYRLIGEALLEGGDAKAASDFLTSAVAVIDAMENSESQVSAVVEIAPVLARAGELGRALAVTVGFPDGVHRAGTLAQITEALARSGQWPAAVEVADRALAAVSAVQAGPLSADTQGTVAEALARAGESRRAIEVAAQALAGIAGLGDKPKQAETACRAARALAAAGEGTGAAEAVRQAFGLATRIDVQWDKATALWVVTQTLTEIGDHPQALVVAGDALTATQAIEDEALQAMPLGQAVQILVQLDRPEEARHAAEAVKGRFWRALALKELAVALAGAGRLEAAHAIARQVESGVLRAQALSAIAEALTRAGDQRQALEVANRALLASEIAEDDSEVPRMLSSIARALAVAGDKQGASQAGWRALAAAAMLTDERLRTWALGDIAHAFAEAGEVAQAMELIGTMDDESKAFALERAAPAMARAGKLDLAMAAAEAIQDDFWRRYALGQMAQTLAAEDPDGALVLLDEIRDASQRVRTLAAVAGHLAAQDCDAVEGYVEEILDIVQSASEDARDYLLAGAVEVLAPLHPPGAEHLSASIATASFKATALVSAAAGRMERGLDAGDAWDQAWQVAQSAQEKTATLALAIARIGRHWHATGDARMADAVGLALHMVWSVPDRVERIDAAVQIAVMLGSFGPDQALVTLDEARRLAGTFAEARAQGQALSRIAGAMMDINPAGACRLLANLCRLGRDSFLGGVACIIPGAARLGGSALVWQIYQALEEAEEFFLT